MAKFPAITPEQQYQQDKRRRKWEAREQGNTRFFNNFPSQFGHHFGHVPDPTWLATTPEEQMRRMRASTLSSRIRAVSPNSCLV